MISQELYLTRCRCFDGLACVAAEPQLVSIIRRTAPEEPLYHSIPMEGNRQ
jgi:hypothetical protein